MSCNVSQYRRFKVYDVPNGACVSRFHGERAAECAQEAAQATLDQNHRDNRYEDGSQLVVVPVRDAFNAPGHRVYLFRVDHSTPRAVPA